MRINETDTVMIIAEVGFLSEFKGQKGVVSRVYPVSRDEGVAVVNMDSGETLKVRFDDLVKITVVETKPAEPVEPEIPEGAKRILKDDVKAFIVSLVDPSKLIFSEGGSGVRDLIRMLTVRIVCDMVVEKIFTDQDAVVMTEEEFISALWNACNPIAMSESIDKKMSPRRCREVALTSFMKLSEIVPTIFGESEE